MEVTEVKIKKLELEKELYRLITEFENTTGAYITDIELPTTRRYSDSLGDVRFYKSGSLAVSVEVMS